MLVLERKRGQIIYIDAPGVGRIQVMLTDVAGRRASLGFICPPGVNVVRKEVANQQPRDRFIHIKHPAGASAFCGKRPGMVHHMVDRHEIQMHDPCDSCQSCAEAYARWLSHGRDDAVYEGGD